MPPTWPWLLVLAPIVGSFVGVVATRFAAPQTILWGRSRCPHCGHSLTARDLVPFASWLALRGRRRHCAAAISAAYPVIELAALAIAVWSLAVADGAMVWVTAGLGWTLLALAAIDWRHFVLPDFLTLPLIAAGLAAAWWRVSPRDRRGGRLRLCHAGAHGLLAAAPSRRHWARRRQAARGCGRLGGVARLAVGRADRRRCRPARRRTSAVAEPYLGTIAFRLARFWRWARGSSGFTDRRSDFASARSARRGAPLLYKIGAYPAHIIGRRSGTIGGHHRNSVRQRSDSR